MPIPALAPLLLRVTLPLAWGGWLYLAFGRATLLLPSGLRALGAGAMVDACASWGATHPPPTWVAWSLPDGLWAYAMVSVHRIVWRGDRSRRAWAWCALAASVGPASELGQALGLVPGVYDPIDLAFYLTGALAGLFDVNPTPPEDTYVHPSSPPP